MTDTQIHVATLMRLQTVVTALQEALPTLQRASLDGMKRVSHTDEATQALKLARAALDVAFGKSTEIPEELRRADILHDAGRTTRFLSLPAGY